MNQKLISLGAGVAAVASIAAGSLVFVGNGQDTTASALSLSDAQVSQLAADVAAQPGAEQAAYLQKLADKLNVSVDTLTAAIKAVNLETIDAKLAAGEITQAQADAAKDRINNSDGVFFGVGPMGDHGRGGPGGPGMMGEDHAALATLLGIDEATLRSEEQAGNSLATIAQNHGKSRDDLKAFLTSQEQAELSQAVTDGKITQAEADTHLQQFSADLDARIDAVHTPGEGPRGGFGGPGRGAPPAAGSTAPGTATN
jgi:hypothetical protein